MTPSIPIEEPTKGVSWPRLLCLAALACGVLALLYYFGGSVSAKLDQLEAFVAGLGPWAPLAFGAMFLVLLPLFVPVSAMKLMAGALFGPWLGMFVALAVQLAASLLIYFLGRDLLAARLQAYVARQPKLAAVQHAAAEGTAKRQFLVRLMPISAALVSYVMAALGVQLRPFLIGCLAMVPSTVVTVWFGHAAVNMPDLAAGVSKERLHSIVVALVVVVLGFALLVWLVRLARKELLEHRHRHEPAPAEAD